MEWPHVTCEISGLTLRPFALEADVHLKTMPITFLLVARGTLAMAAIAITTAIGTVAIDSLPSVSTAIGTIAIITLGAIAN